MRYRRSETRVVVPGGLSFIFLIAASCGGGEPQTPVIPPPIGVAGASGGGAAGSPQTTSPVATAGSTAVPSAVAGSNASVAGSASVKPPDMKPAQMVPGVPCDVASIVSENCTTCHSAMPSFSAPMPLMKHADFHALSKTQPTKKIFEITPARINATDIKLRMPPASGKAIAAPGLKAFNDWLAAGAVATTPSCDITAKGTTPMPAAGSGAVDPNAPPRSGGATNMPQKYDDPLLKCYEFRAHAQGSKTAPFMVGTSPDMYTNFSFAAPWQGTVYARSMRVLQGNDEIIHHWLFYKDAVPGADGAISPSIGAHPTGELMHGWAPGGSDLYLDPDVGLELPSDVGYTLETHHNNTTGSAKPDTAGIEVCVTPTMPKNVASLSWLGTDNLNGTTATGTCAPLAAEPIHIIGIQPHMHLKGKHMKAVIRRTGGMMETLHDEPFDFEYQHSYDIKTILMPGESITTTCTYTGPVRFGEGTNDEMCYMFTLYYPKLSLTNGNPVASLIHGPNTCLE